MRQPLIIKVGGALLESIEAQNQIFGVIAQIKQQGVSIVLVHGGGCLVESWLNQAGFKSEKLDGLRITPPDQIELVTGALAGAANKKLVARAKANQLNAVGLSLGDGDMVSASQVSPELGQVGQCLPLENTLLTILMAKDYLPIISSIACDSNGELLNVNADQAAQQIAQLLQGKLVLLSDVAGVLDGNKQLINQLNQQYALELMASGVIDGGMKVKVEAAFATANELNDSIVIASWQQPEQLIALINGKKCGTLIEPN